MSQYEFDGWKSVLKKQDEKLLTRIRGHDLFACEAKFHNNCRINYMQIPAKWRSSDEATRQQQHELEKAHRTAFVLVCYIIEKEILNDQKVLKLS